MGLAVLYVLIALGVSLYDVWSPAPPGSWLVLRGIGVCVVTLPACFVVEKVFPTMGLPRPSFYNFPEGAYPVIALIGQILVCAVLVYAITAWIQGRARTRRKIS